MGRRLFRSGESEYLLDGQKVRLKDVLDALRRVGIDGARHIVVTQGMADALLSATPSERRALLEQAAGLSEYRVKREEARQKLGTTEQNISMVMAILAELEPRLRHLRRQSRAIQERNAAQVLLRHRLHDWHAARRSEVLGRLAEHQTSAAEMERNRREAESQLTALESAAEAVLERERVWQQSVNTLLAAQHVSQRALDAAVQQSGVLHQQIASARQRREALSAREQRVDGILADLQARYLRVEESLVQLQMLVDRARTATQEAAQRVDEQRRSVREREATSAELEMAAKSRSRATEETGRQLSALRRESETVAGQIREIERRLEHHKVTAETLERAQSDLLSRLECIETASVVSDERLNECEARWERARQRLSRFDVIVARLNRLVTDEARREQALRRSLDSLGDETARTVLQTIQVEPGWERAIASALGEWAWVRLEQTSSAHLHPADDAQLHRWRNSLESHLSDCIWADSVVRAMPAECVNPLDTTILVDDASAARRTWNNIKDLPGRRVGTTQVQVVSRQGERWSPAGIEKHPQNDRAANFLQLRRAVGKSQKRHAVLSSRAGRLRNARQAEAAAMAISAEETEAARRRAHEDRREREGLGHQLALTVQQIENLGPELSRAHSEHAQLSNRLESLQNHIRDLARSLSERRMEEEETVRLAQSAAGDLKVLRNSLAQAEHEYRDSAHDAAMAESKLMAQKQVIIALEEERERTRTDLPALQEEDAALECAVRAYESELVSLEEEIRRLEVGHRRDTDCLRAAQEQRPPGYAGGTELRQARAAATSAVARHERALAEVQTALNDLTRVDLEVVVDLGIEPANLCPSDDPAPSDADIRRLRGRASQYAGVDESVTREAAELETRHGYLLAQVADLQAAADTLGHMMEVADSEMKSRFETAFTAVNEEFSRVFEVMLPGGSARLEWSSESGGVDIAAQLPGKRARSNASFSGGERSLVASSLLFGVLRMRPTPFCVLDEVDAALDEGNVDRYLAALRDISTRTQAVVVTHNRATMAAADVLYGITLSGEGASNVLSLRLESVSAG